MHTYAPHQIEGASVGVVVVVVQLVALLLPDADAAGGDGVNQRL
jgi:hypothetical protein